MKPLLLDLFCKDGGASMGYNRAGFEVVGVDIERRVKYPFDFIHADALEVLRILLSGGTVRSDGLFGREYALRDLSAIAASPPCQAYCALKHFTKKKYPELVEAVRELLKLTGAPYVLENVPGAPLCDPTILCGTMFGLQTDCGAVLIRHRLFETNWGLQCHLNCNHGGRSLAVVGSGSTVSGAKRSVISVTGHTANGHAAVKAARCISIAGSGAPQDHSMAHRRRRSITTTGSTAQMNVVHNTQRKTFSVKDAQKAMGIGWMSMDGLSQAIPPAYTQFIGNQLIKELAV